MPDPVDVHVGSRIKLRRQLLGLSQGKLAKALRLTFQQVQKYEKGTNRVSASRLFAIGSTLNVPIVYFFDDMPSKMAEMDAPPLDGPTIDRETVAFVRHYELINSREVKRRVRALIKTLGDNS